MASLYQRFSGKINTNNSFPHPPPEASRLLGGQVTDEDNGGKPREPVLVEARVHVPFRKKRSEDEAVRPSFFYQNHPGFFLIFLKLMSKWKVLQRYRRPILQSYIIREYELLRRKLGSVGFSLNHSIDGCS
jgi:hypothetical protein